jgi:hypothetical protein
MISWMFPDRTAFKQSTNVVVVGILLLGLAVSPTASSAVENRDSHPFQDLPARLVKPLVLRDTNNNSNNNNNIPPYQGLRASVDRILQVGNCPNLADIQDPAGGSCSPGKEYDEPCSSDTDCYSGHCETAGTGRCYCPTAADCEGCASDRAACVRIEQTHTFQDLTICEMSARQGPHTAIPMFSTGGAWTTDYSKLAFLKLEKNEHCTTFSPFVDTSPQQLLPAAFAQANADTDNVDDIGSIVLYGDIDSFIDSLLFINGNWIKTIELADKQLGGRKPIQVHVWPRVSIATMTDLQTAVQDASSVGLMLVLELSGAAVLDFDIPAGVGVEFLGVTPDAKLIVQKDASDPFVPVLSAGRLSLKNLIVDFESGILEIQGTSVGPTLDSSVHDSFLVHPTIIWVR